VNALEITLRSTGDAPRTRSLACTEPVWFGRDPSCQVVLDSELVSRRHACVEAGTHDLSVRDCSANGTRVDGVLLQRARRSTGPEAVLEIGPYQLQVRLRSGALAAPLVAPHTNASLSLRRRIQRRLLDQLDLAHRSPEAIDAEHMRPDVLAALQSICESFSAELPDAQARSNLVRELTDEALGLGPLEQLLSDTTVSEIMVIDPDTIYVERRGLIEPTGLRFTDDEAVRSAIERIITPLGRRIDESSPLVDARLADGSRVNAVIPPLARRGPCITIRKFQPNAFDLDDLVERGALSRAMAELLASAVRARKNIVVSGGTGSGKTTLLNALSSAVAPGERIVTIEDAAELRLRQPHVVSLESRPANMEGKGAYTIRDLVRNALRMRPDRILVGECRGGEAIDMLQAMNSGHEGSMTTTHANSAHEAVARLETLALMAGLQLPAQAIRRQIAASIHLIVQQGRFADGARRVTSISEVVGCDAHGEVELAELFKFERGFAADELGAGQFRASGRLPSFADELVPSADAAERSTP
jgi:pilus assembly protein CpaF